MFMQRWGLSRRNVIIGRTKGKGATRSYTPAEGESRINQKKGRFFPFPFKKKVVVREEGKGAITIDGIRCHLFLILR